jgi:hypothetical protein
MRNTKAIIEAICNYTSFDTKIKAGLTYLKESNIDIAYWKYLSSKEEELLIESSQDDSVTLSPDKIKSAFNRFSGNVSGDIAKEKKQASFGDWSEKNPIKLKSTEPATTKSEQNLKAHKEDREKYINQIPYMYRHMDKLAMSGDERIKTDIEASKNSYYDLIMKTERNIGKTNIKNYIEKISEDVENFVALVIYLTDQIVKEAWLKSPEKIQKVFGNSPYFLESPALAIRGSNIKGFLQESATVLQLATDVSKYFVLDNANNDIRKSVEEAWPDVMKITDEKIKQVKVVEPVKAMISFNESSENNFFNNLEESIWEIIPNIIKEHGDEFFLIIENKQETLPQFDAFKSSQFQSYNPIFETMYYELREKKPFNWLLKLERELVDDKEIERNLELCTQALVQEQLSSIKGYTYPTVGLVSGFTAHKLVQESYNEENGLGTFLDVRDSLWITSGYVPGTFGLILLLLNVASAVLFVATAEDIVGFDIAKSYPQFTGLPIWEAFKNGSLDLKAKFEEDRKNQKAPIEKTGIASPRNAKKTGIKFD